VLEDFHLQLIEIAAWERRGLVLYPAAHGKTTIVSTLLTIWAICRDPNIRISLIAKNEFEAKSIMRSIQRELIANDELIEDFGPFVPVNDDSKAWSLERIDVVKRTSRAKEGTLTVFGAGAQTALGTRSDWTIMDDVVTDKNSVTPEQRAKLRQWFDLAVSTMPEKYEDRIIVVGTLFDPNDLYNDIMLLSNPDTGELIWDKRRIDAIVDEEKKISLWPRQWPWPRLMEEKARGTLDFNKRFRNIAVDPSRQVFKEVYVKGGWERRVQYPGCLDRGFCIGDDIDPSWKVIAGFDPAVGTGRHAKFCAHIIVAAGACPEHKRCFWVLDLFRDQLTLPQQIDMILTRHEQYGCFASKVESNSYQMGLFQAIKQRMDDQGIAFKIEEHLTTAKRKQDAEIGVQAMSPVFENGWVHIPWGDAASQRKMSVLVEELVEYPSGRTTDTVMAFWFAWLGLQSSAPRYKAFRRPGAPQWTNGRSQRTLKNPYYEDRRVV
jgi:phage terminase large subunit-like protein